MALELIYFNGRGLGEVPRLVLAEAKLEFKDTRVESGSKEWTDLKPNTPFGQMPVLKVGDDVIAQSSSIVRYIANKGGLAGSTPLEAAHIDSLYEHLLELRQKFSTKKYAKEDAEAKGKEFYGEILPKYLTLWEKLLKASKGPFFFGDKTTYADIAIFHYVNEILLEKQENLEKFPTLKGFLDAVAARPNIAAYLKTRPQTPW